MLFSISRYVSGFRCADGLQVTFWLIINFSVSWSWWITSDFLAYKNLSSSLMIGHDYKFFGWSAHSLSVRNNLKEELFPFPWDLESLCDTRHLVFRSLHHVKCLWGPFSINLACLFFHVPQFESLYGYCSIFLIMVEGTSGNFCIYAEFSPSSFHLPTINLFCHLQYLVIMNKADQQMHQGC